MPLYLFWGPLVAALLLFIFPGFDISQFVDEKSSSARRIGDLLSMLVLFVVPASYAIGALPASLTGAFTRRRILKTGHCSMVRSAAYGAVFSVLIAGGVQFAWNTNFGGITGGASQVMSEAWKAVLWQGTIGFVGTLAVWWLTRARRHAIGMHAAAARRIGMAR